MKAFSRNPTRWEEPACRHLAIGVIDRAFRDLTGVGGSRADQESARVFLAGSSMFYYWCAVANLNATWMVTRAKKLMAASGPFKVHDATQGSRSATQIPTFHARREEKPSIGLRAGLQDVQTGRRHTANLQLLR